MSIADYSDLLMQVSEYTGRDDFGHVFPRLVSFAENKMNRALRVGGMETSASLTTSSSGNVALPTGFLEMREVKDSAGRILDAVTPAAGDYIHGPYAGSTINWYVKGSTFYTVPYSEATFTILYYTKITPLTAAATTNWLLADAPMVYLYGVAAEVVGWAIAQGKEDVSKLSGYAQLLQGEIDAYQMQDRSKRYSNVRVVNRGLNP